jgi:hypothetical protein
VEPVLFVFLVAQAGALARTRRRPRSPVRTAATERP